MNRSLWIQVWMMIILTVGLSGPAGYLLAYLTF